MIYKQAGQIPLASASAKTFAWPETATANRARATGDGHFQRHGGAVGEACRGVCDGFHIMTSVIQEM